MGNNQGLDVVEWENPPPTLPRKERTRRGFIPPMYLGILGTLILHALALHSLKIGQSSIAKPPEVQKPAAVGPGSKVDETLVLLMSPATADSTRIGTSTFVSPQLNFNTLKTIAVAIDPPSLPNVVLPLSDDKAPKPEEGGGETGEQARLFGLYTGQMRARIERVWRRPRSAVNVVNSDGNAAAAETFQCQVQIVQDSHGNVQEILLPDCNGSPAWQRSLVVAIQQASPLPAPPSASVFTQSLSLSFVGLSFTNDGLEEEYELPPRTVSRTGTPVRQ